MSTTPFLHWHNLVFGHSPARPLNTAFSGEISQPGIFAIKGANGCGKSSLLRTWLGLLKPLSGSVDRIPPKSRAGGENTNGLGYVPQSHSVNKFFPISVADFVAQGFGPQKKTAKNSAALETALSTWHLMQKRTHSFHTLSVGQKTRAMVARAVVSSPQVLFLDEPLASLDMHCQVELMNSLHELTREKSVCVLMVDHHFQAFESLLSGELIFDRGHDQETCEIILRAKQQT